jgi:hypothetical protein
MGIISAFLSKYLFHIIAVVAVIALLAGVYYKGVNDKANETALDNAKQLIEINKKIINIEKYSISQAAESKENIATTSGKLETILKLSKDKVIVNKECQPTSEFAKTWNELSEATK